MAQLIGGMSVVEGTRGYGSRVQAPSPGVGMSEASGLRELASALAGTGAVGQSYLDRRIKEEEERLGYDALLKWNTFTGTFGRRIEELKLAQPVDGAGYAGTVEKEFTAGFNAFLKEIPASLRPEFQARAEGIRQRSLFEADSFTRQATRQWGLTTVERSLEEARTAVYRNPDLDMDSSMDEIIDAAPGLTAAEKDALRHSKRENLRGAAMGGIIRDARQKSFAVPFSAEVNEQLIPALINQESGGRADAISPKGAQGLMQIMPGTARMIANQIGDRNYPHGAGFEAERAYMLRKDVNLTYGTYHINDLLRKYGGDVELALIAYNAGPGKADTYKESGRDWSSMPAGVQSETKPYVRNIMEKIGGLTPEMVRDPQYGLNLEQMVSAEGDVEGIVRQAESDAHSYITNAMAEAEAAQAGMIQQLQLEARAGGDGPGRYYEELQKGTVAYDNAAMNELIRITKDVSGEQIATQEAFGKLASGQTLSVADGDRVITPDLQEGMLRRDEGAIGAVVDRVHMMGFIPPKIERTLEQMMFGGLEDVSAAAQAIREMEVRNPVLVRELDQDLTMRAAAFESMRSAGLPADQIQLNLDATKTQEQRAALDTRKAADDTYEENKFISMDEATNYFASYWSKLPFNGGVEAPIDPGIANLFQLQYQAVYDAAYAQTGDSGRAKEIAMEQVAKQWGPTKAGGGPARLTWLPPEQALTQFRFDTNNDGTLEVVTQTPGQALASFNRQVEAKYGVDSFAVTATQDTLSAMQNGSPVPYSIIPLDDEGQPNYSTPELLSLMTGEGFKYDYGLVQTSMQVLLSNRRLLQDELINLETSTPLGQALDPNVMARMEELRAKISEIDEDLGR